jgi:hypothetical protein
MVMQRDGIGDEAQLVTCRTEPQRQTLLVSASRYGDVRPPPLIYRRGGTILVQTVFDEQLPTYAHVAGDQATCRPGVVESVRTFESQFVDVSGRRLYNEAGYRRYPSAREAGHESCEPIRFGEAIAVQKGHEVPMRLADAAIPAGVCPEMAVISEGSEFQGRMASGEIPQEVHRAIGRAVVHDNDLEARIGLAGKRLQAIGQYRSSIAGRQDHGDQRRSRW